jgi:hypothetical protein
MTFMTTSTKMTFIAVRSLSPGSWGSAGIVHAADSDDPTAKVAPTTSYQVPRYRSLCGLILLTQYRAEGATTFDQVHALDKCRSCAKSIARRAKP